MTEATLQITARNIRLSNSLDSEIRSRADKLHKFYDRITRCRVIIDSPHRRKNHGKEYHVKVTLSVPGTEVAVRKEDQDLYSAIKTCFDAVRRRLEDVARKQRGDMKVHEETPRAKISSLFPEQGYGFITTSDNQDIYFHENSIMNSSIERLTIGMAVRYSEVEGEKGPRASAIKII